MREVVTEIAAHVALCRCTRTGIAWVEDGTTGQRHSAHPATTGSVRVMRERAMWRPGTRAVRTHGIAYNIDEIHIHTLYDAVAGAYCQCGSREVHTTADLRRRCDCGIDVLEENALGHLRSEEHAALRFVRQQEAQGKHRCPDGELLLHLGYREVEQGYTGTRKTEAGEVVGTRGYWAWGWAFDAWWLAYGQAGYRRDAAVRPRRLPRHHRRLVALLAQPEQSDLGLAVQAAWERFQATQGTPEADAVLASLRRMVTDNEDKLPAAPRARKENHHA